MNLDIIAIPLGHFLKFIYDTIAFHNYGLAIIIFTVVIKLVLLPLTVKQYKSTAKMQQIQPQLQELQKRYKSDKEKLNQETLKLYQENKVNPAGGCLPLLIQMPILIVLYWIIVEPLKFMLNKTPAQIDKLSSLVPNIASMGFRKEISILNYFSEHTDKLANTGGLLKSSELINMNFLGLHLGQIPTYNPQVLFGKDIAVYLPLLVIPIVAVITTYISAKLSMPRRIQNSGNDNSTQNSMQNSMLYIGPVMTLIFSFSLPAGVGLYWTIGYVIQIFQQLYINKHVLNRKEVLSK